MNWFNYFRILAQRKYNKDKLSKLMEKFVDGTATEGDEKNIDILAEAISSQTDRLEEIAKVLNN